MSKRKGKGKKRGRPTSYKKRIADEICARLASGELLKDICSEKGMPSRSTVYHWLFSRPEFSDTYARAREAQMESWAEDIIEIADDGSNDTYEDDEGNEKVNHDVIQRSKLRVDSRKWLMSKLSSKRYGDKVQAEVSGAGGGPMQAVLNVTIGGQPPPASEAG